MYSHKKKLQLTPQCIHRLYQSQHKSQRTCIIAFMETIVGFADVGRMVSVLAHPDVLATDKDLGHRAPPSLQPFLQLFEVELVHIDVPLLHSHSEVVEHAQNIPALLKRASHSAERCGVDHHFAVLLRFLHQMKFEVI